MKKCIYLLVLVLLLSGCSAAADAPSQSEGGNTVHLLISRDYGNTVIFEEDIPYVDGLSVLEYLEDHCEVETAYGGGFVNGIDGLTSGYTGKSKGEKMDWFYYVNGIFAHVGALDYCPESGDVVHWDYHNWEASMSPPAIVGGWDAIFKNGYDGEAAALQIQYAEGFEDQAASVAETLESHDVVLEGITAFDPNSVGELDYNTILIGEWNQVMTSKFIEGAIKNWKKTGMFFKVGEDGVEIYDDVYLNHKVYPSAGMIFALQKSYAEPYVVWVMTGTSEEEAKAAVEAFAASPEFLSGKISIMVNEGQMMNVPYHEE